MHKVVQERGSSPWHHATGATDIKQRCFSYYLQILSEMHMTVYCSWQEAAVQPSPSFLSPFFIQTYTSARASLPIKTIRALSVISNKMNSPPNLPLSNPCRFQLKSTLSEHQSDDSIRKEISPEPWGTPPKFPLSLLEISPDTSPWTLTLPH